MVFYMWAWSGSFAHASWLGRHKGIGYRWMKCISARRMVSGYHALIHVGYTMHIASQHNIILSTARGKIKYNLKTGSTRWTF